MKKILLIVLSLIAIPSAFCVGPASDHPASVAILLGLDSVRSDLKISNSQAAQLDEIRSSFRAKSRLIVSAAGTSNESHQAAEASLFALRDKTSAQALAVLTSKQKKRLQEVESQFLGGTILVSPKIQKQLNLTAAQTASIEKIRAKGTVFVTKLNATYKDGAISHQERIIQLRNRRLADAGSLLRVLSPSQRQAFANLTGKPVRRI